MDKIIYNYQLNRFIIHNGRRYIESNDLSMNSYSLDLSILLSEGTKRNTNILSSSERKVFRSASKVVMRSLSVESEQQNSLNIELECSFNLLNH